MANIPLSRIIYPMKKSQSGAALIIALVLLMALTIIGISTLSTTSLEHRMAGNMGDLNLAFNATETAGRAVQAIITPLSSPPNEQDSCANKTTTDSPLCVIKKQSGNWWEDMSHSDWATDGVELAGTGTVDTVKTQPHVVIENFQYVPDTLVTGLDYITKGTQYYRVTSRGTGRSDESQAVVQQTLVKRYN